MSDEISCEMIFCSFFYILLINLKFIQGIIDICIEKLKFVFSTKNPWSSFPSLTPVQMILQSQVYRVICPSSWSNESHKILGIIV